MSRKYVAILEASRELLKSYGYFVGNLWHVDDIHFLCEEKNLSCLSDEEAMEIFYIAGERFDGEFGIGWLQLEKAVDYYQNQKKQQTEVLDKNFVGVI